MSGTLNTKQDKIMSPIKTLFVLLLGVTLGVAGTSFYFKPSEKPASTENLSSPIAKEEVTSVDVDKGNAEDDSHIEDMAKELIQPSDTDFSLYDPAIEFDRLAREERNSTDGDPYVESASVTDNALATGDSSAEEEVTSALSEDVNRAEGGTTQFTDSGLTESDALTKEDFPVEEEIPADILEAGNRDIVVSSYKRLAAAGFEGNSLVSEVAAATGFDQAFIRSTIVASGDISLNDSNGEVISSEAKAKD